MAYRLETFGIIAVSVLLIVFIALYFHQKSGYKKLRKKDIEDIESGILEPQNNESEKDIVLEWTEQLQIIKAQLDLMFDLSPVFIACFDFVRDYFSLSENGYDQLNLAGYSLEDGGGIEQSQFEKLIHPEDISVYDEIKRCKDIRMAEISESPYVLRLKCANGEYRQYIAKVKPVYDIRGNSVAMIFAFVSADI